ncbi:(Fe-S)-binding protein [Methanobrevibacter filiformis]|uniref:Epoxyqueuosine reductase n=1 Tax=Methanobrevibacter filiformis TaxID=55758 RepID=A0A166AL73_9EURY|nr:(Fe-S)-binding protein [Methanobrevibacter filiformis]KZX12181.1 epoxyqueuosine reductase [Methanobrevibacter filiformis]
MKDFLIKSIKEFVLTDEFNKHEFSDICFEEPLVKIASAENPLFEKYKNIIGKEHLTPKEAYEKEFGENSFNKGSVISISLPISEEIIKSNRKEKAIPSLKWTLMRSYGAPYKVASYLIDLLNKKGFKGISPGNTKWFTTYQNTDLYSNWSERHIAYVAGLGTFSLNQGFITEKGIANRLISVITDLELESDERTSKNHLSNCLYFVDGKCQSCVKRCPINAISPENGIDKLKCHEQGYGEDAMNLAISRGGIGESGSGCGLCQTGVPCERINPLLRLKSKV